MHLYCDPVTENGVASTLTPMALAQTVERQVAFQILTGRGQLSQRVNARRSLSVDYKPITDPAELETLSPSELFERVRPLLRKGGLTRNYAELERIKPNIPSVCAELAAAWESSPRLTEGEVPFADYLAARLCTALRALDRRQYPELYDRHGKYQPDGQPQPLDEETLASIPPTTGVKEPLFISFPERKARLANALHNAGIHPASQAALLTNVEQTASGKMTPYRWSKADGLSTLDAHHHPASAAHLATLRYLDRES